MMAPGEVRGPEKGQGIGVGVSSQWRACGSDRPSLRVSGQVTPIPGQAKLLCAEQQL